MEFNNTVIKNEMNNEGLQGLFIEQLKDLYSAENQLIKALPKMEKAAVSFKLKAAFMDHLQVTQQHVNRLEKILGDLHEKPNGAQCKAMEGIVEEGKSAIDKKQPDANIKDAGLIAAAQRVEHYEMAGYGTVRAYAKMLGLDDAVKLLHQTLQEEGQADKVLTQISNELLTNKT